MCELCGHYPHVPGCPEEVEDKEARSLFHCDACGFPVEEGDEYFEVEDSRLCWDCFDEYQYEEKRKARREAC